jgi:hypothetical protein
MAINARQFPLALDALSHIHKVTPERAFTLFSEQAFCYLKLNQVEQARPLIARAEQYAKTPEEKSRIEDFAKFANTLGQMHGSQQ